MNTHMNKMSCSHDYTFWLSRCHTSEDHQVEGADARAAAGVFSMGHQSVEGAREEVSAHRLMCSALEDFSFSRL